MRAPRPVRIAVLGALLSTGVVVAMVTGAVTHAPAPGQAPATLSVPGHGGGTDR